MVYFSSCQLLSFAFQRMRYWWSPEGLTPPEIQDIEDPKDFWKYLEVAKYQLKALEAQAEHIAFKVEFTKALITHFGHCIRGLQSEEHEG